MNLAAIARQSEVFIQEAGAPISPADQIHNCTGRFCGTNCIRGCLRTAGICLQAGRRREEFLESRSRWLRGADETAGRANRPSLIRHGGKVAEKPQKHLDQHKEEEWNDKCWLCVFRKGPCVAHSRSPSWHVAYRVLNIQTWSLFLPSLLRFQPPTHFLALRAQMTRHSHTHIF